MHNPQNAEEAAAMAEAEAAAAAAAEAEWQEAEAARAQYEAEAQKQQEAKHTPGPWRAFKSTDGYSVDDYIGGIHPAPKVEGNGEDEARANAALIGAAPDLLEVAQEALRHFQGEDLETATLTKYDLIPLLEEAIKKATYTEEL